MYKIRPVSKMESLGHTLYKPAKCCNIDSQTWASFVDMIFANNVIEAAASVAIEQ